MADGYKVEFAAVLANCARMLALLPTEDLRLHNEAAAQSVERMEAVGCVLDPASYFENLQSGRLDDARLQNEIGRHLLAARIAIDAREQFVARLKDSQDRRQANVRSR